MTTSDFEPRMLTLKREAPAYMQWLMWGFIALLVAGVGIGIAGRVATACFLVGASTAGVTIIRFLRSLKRRKIELILPMGLALLLIVVAFTLPHAK
jgi:hypothetical protein